jgi:hypothetical protein
MLVRVNMAAFDKFNVDCKNYTYFFGFFQMGKPLQLSFPTKSTG